MTVSKFKLPLSPYLENSTGWWMKENPGEKYTTKSIYKEYVEKYHQWMFDQGVIIKDNSSHTVKLTFEFDYYDIEFIDEQSMLMFAIRWGN
jgi:hypothetical protein